MDLLPLALEALLFLVVVGATLWAGRRLEEYFVLQRRLRGEGGSESRAETGSSLLKKEGVQNPFLAWVQSATSISEERDRNKLRRELALAGIDNPAAPAIYVVTRFSLAVGLPIAYNVSQYLVSTPETGTKLVLFTAFLCGVGLIAPRAVLDNRIEGRRTQMENEFPDALDLLVVCVEAGLGFEAAISRVSAEVATSHPLISAAFERVNQEMRAGRSRADALRAMGERTDVEAIRAFVALMVQSDALGASIGQTLRTYSAEMRETRYFKAEEKAMRVPVLMTVPLIACILPVIIATVMLPAIIDVIRVLIPMMGSSGK